ncbi:hypothetical protein DB347_00735 [Opitutaceae bacterium EW11]|nr:hypothetical protein DB347_00735 [Opitutaceae bacterium EW11]
MALLASWATASAAEFTEHLTPEQKKAIGYAKLNQDQISTLNNLVERELILAKQGNVSAFAGEFTQRRSAPERAKAGVGKLNADEVTSLNALVAAEIANRPVQPATTETVAVSNAVRGIGPKPIIHGSVSFTVGTSGGGRNFYGGTVEVEQTDPVKGYSIAIAYSEFHGKGLFWPYWCGPYTAGPYRDPWYYGRRGW